MKHLYFSLAALALAAARLPTVCNYGKYIENPLTSFNCTNCPSGKYRDTVKWDVQCKDCPAGENSGEGSIKCTSETTGAEADAATTEPVVAAGGVGLAAGATIGVAYYATTT